MATLSAARDQFLLPALPGTRKESKEVAKQQREEEEKEEDQDFYPVFLTASTDLSLRT